MNHKSIFRTLCLSVLLAAGLASVSAQAANLVLYTSQPNEDAQATVDRLQFRYQP